MSPYPIRSILGNTRRPDITIHASGQIDITAYIAETLDLQEGDSIDILTDGVEYYLYVAARKTNASGRHHALCRPSKAGSRHFRAYSRPLVTAILSQCGSRKHAAFTIGLPTLINGHKAIPIITRHPI